MVLLILLITTVRILSLDNNRVTGEAWHLLLKDDSPYVLSVDHFVFVKQVCAVTLSLRIILSDNSMCIGLPVFHFMHQIRKLFLQ